MAEKKNSEEEASFHPEPGNPLRAPFVPLSASRKMIRMLGWSVVGLAATSIILASSFITSLNRKPWVLVNTADGFQEMDVQGTRTTRAEVERFLNFVIPSLYGSINGKAPGLEKVQGLVNENIVRQISADLGGNAGRMQTEGISQFAIVTGINQETMVIDRDKKMAYAEVFGTIVLSQERKSRRTDVQWRVLMYIVEPTDKLASETPVGKMLGNRMGLFLQQIAEQTPGTINEDSPKPSAADAAERERERKETEQTQKPE